MQQRTLSGDLTVSAIGLGCMGMSEFYGATDEGEALKTLHRAVDLGVTFLDTADMYGVGENEKLLGKFVKERGRDAVTIATKFGIIRDGFDYAPRNVDISNTPQYARAALEASLKRLGVETIDLYYVHRIDPNQPIEAVMEVLADFVREGKIRHIGLSEAAPKTLRRACAVHHVSALQTEYSLWSREPEVEIIDLCADLGVGFVPYSPLGRGYLTGALKTAALEPGDWRRSNPRFQAEAEEQNAKIVDKIVAFANEKETTPARILLAWILAQGDHIVPIPGTKRTTYLEDNAGAVDLVLSSEELAALSAIAPIGATSGDRYPASGMKQVSV